MMNTENTTKSVEQVDTDNIFGKVVDVTEKSYDNHEDEVVINKGERDGIVYTDRFLIYALGKELYDPDTGENLGKLEIVKGIAKPKHIQPKATTLVSAEYQPVGKRIIDRNVIFGREEEVIESSPDTVPFRNVKVGDLVKPMKRRIS